MIDQTFKQQVKDALKEIEYDNWHESIHSRIRSKLGRDTPPGKSGFCQCGICEQIFTINKREIKEQV